jgi:TolA-binding protein
MEVFMKKTAFIFIMFFAMSAVVSDTILANTDTEYDKALKYYNSGKYKEAAMLLKEYVKKNPEPPAYYRIGYALYELGKYDEATEYFKAAYLIDPTFSPKKIGSTQNYPEDKSKKVIKPSGKQVPSKKKPYIPARMRSRSKY